MYDNLNKEFRKYLEAWAYISKYDTTAQYLLRDLSIFSAPTLNKDYSSIKNLKNLQFSNPNQLHFLLVELSLIELTLNHRNVITLRYINNLKWDIISFKTNFSRRACFYLRKDVLNKLRDLHIHLCT